MFNSNDIIDFWFEQIEPAQWWKKDDDFDALILERFADLHRVANAGELYQWRSTAQGRLAEIIVLDQFSRNMYRGSAESFASDTHALILAQEAISGQYDEQLSETQRGFMYLPFMHSESLLVHEWAEQLYRDKGSAANLKFELRHKAIIERFGRYPHRNEILGRASTQEEIEFLATPGSSF